MNRAVPERLNIFYIDFLNLEVDHFGEDCYSDCNERQGPCNWCGDGYCCRKDWYDPANGCDGKHGISGLDYHVCVAGPPPSTWDFLRKYCIFLYEMLAGHFKNHCPQNID